MGRKSTAVKRIATFEADTPEGVVEVLEIHWVDPGQPTVLKVDQFRKLSGPIHFISLTLTI
jgi:hypothetical protein